MSEVRLEQTEAHWGDFDLYRRMTAPLEPCGPDCDVMCVCPLGNDEGELDGRT